MDIREANRLMTAAYPIIRAGLDLHAVFYAGCIYRRFVAPGSIQFPGELGFGFGQKFMRAHLILAFLSRRC